MHIFEPLLLGLSTGPFCFGYCASVLIPFLMSEQRRNINTISLIGLFFAGRLMGYITIGLFSGVLGSAFSGRHQQQFETFAALGMGLFLLVFGLTQNFPGLRLCRIFECEKSSASSNLVLGMLTSVNPCPPIIAAITCAVATGTILNSLYYFLLFFIGTSLILLPVWVSGLFARFHKLRIVARVCLLLSGIWLSIKGIGMLIYIIE